MSNPSDASPATTPYRAFVDVRKALVVRGWQRDQRVKPPRLREHFVLPHTDWQCVVDLRANAVYFGGGGVTARRDLLAVDEIVALLDEIRAKARLDAERERLGRLVREVWVAYCRTIGDEKPAHLAPWEALSEQDREVDRLIGERLYGEGFHDGYHAHAHVMADRDGGDA